MTIFLSSTCYDLRDVRAEIEKYLEGLNHKLLLSDRDNFPIDLSIHRHDVCLQNVKLCELFILVLDTRFGAPYYKDPTISITWAEFREAVTNNKEIIVFYRKELAIERRCYKNNYQTAYKPTFVDNLKCFDFFDEIQNHPNGIWMQEFNNSVEIKTQLQYIHSTNNSVLNTTNYFSYLSLDNIVDIHLNSFSLPTMNYLQSIEIHDDINIDKLIYARDIIPEQEITIEVTESNDNIEINSNDFLIRSNTILNGEELSTKISLKPTAIGISVRNELNRKIEDINLYKKSEISFIDVLKRKPVYLSRIIFNNVNYIFGIYEKEYEFHTSQSICILSLFGGKWFISFEKELEGEDCFTEIVKINGLEYQNNVFIYIERIIQRMGNAHNGLGELEVSLIDLVNKFRYEVKLDGEYRLGKLEGNFIFPNLTSNSFEQSYKYIVEQEIIKSELIYKTPNDYDISSPQNCIDKWIVDNPDYHNKDNGHVIFTFYEQNIFWKTESYGDDETYHSNKYIEENEKYILETYFAGPLLCFDKLKQKYFVVLVLEGNGKGAGWGARSIQEITFLNENSIVAITDYEKFTINLENGEYTNEEYSDLSN